MSDFPKKWYTPTTEILKELGLYEYKSDHIIRRFFDSLPAGQYRRFMEYSNITGHITLSVCDYNDQTGRRIDEEPVFSGFLPDEDSFRKVVKWCGWGKTSVTELN